jgi:hypothetical protein
MERSSQGFQSISESRRKGCEARQRDILINPSPFPGKICACVGEVEVVIVICPFSWPSDYGWTKVHAKVELCLLVNKRRLQRRREVNTI